MFRRIRAFWKDQRGVALILFSVMLPATIGFSLLVIDLGRANNLHNDLQKGADAFALAAGAELDGTADSITRADRALSTLVHNNYNFSTAPGVQELAAAGVSRRYLRSLPASDSSPITSANVITDELTDAVNAHYVEVTVTPVGFSAIFPVSFVTPGGNGDWTIGATAVAGFKSGVCDYTPVFICNPYEDTSITNGVTLEDAAQTRAYRRRQIVLRGDGSYVPGNFAFLSSPFGTGANALEKMLADSKPQNCYSRDGVDTEPGQNAGPVENGINSRFGINSSDYSDGPALNVRKGAKNWDQYVKSNKIDYETDPNKGVGLERDACQIAGSCTMMGGRMGAGDWNFARYWAVNHSSRAVPSALSGTGADLPTRYETYRYEIDPNGDGNTSDNIISDAAVGGEKGTPPAGAGAPITSSDRRLLYGAILDCNALQASGISFKGRATGIPVRRFGSFFITEPIKDGKNIYVELVDITGKGGRGTLDNLLRNEVQLYR